MRRQLPPMPSLRAFEAAARHLSFRRAADELAVTPSAVSHQVRALEEWLGRELFRRTPGAIALRPAGEAYLRDLTPLLDALDASSRRLCLRTRGAGLRVLSTPGFAARWLVPRLERYPDAADLRIAVSEGAPDTDFTRNGADVVIHWGAGPVPGVHVEPMMISGRYPVAAPGYAAREGIARPADLASASLLHDEVEDGWADWFALAGLRAVTLPCGPRLAHCELTLTAAERGQGVALAYDAMARGALAEGRLVRLFDAATPPRTIYSFAIPADRRDASHLRAFRDWMFAEVADEGVAAPARTPRAAE